MEDNINLNPKIQSFPNVNIGGASESINKDTARSQQLAEINNASNDAMNSVMKSPPKALPKPPALSTIVANASRTPKPIPKRLANKHSVIAQAFTASIKGNEQIAASPKNSYKSLPKIPEKKDLVISKTFTDALSRYAESPKNIPRPLRPNPFKGSAITKTSTASVGDAQSRSRPKPLPKILQISNLTTEKITVAPQEGELKADQSNVEKPIAGTAELQKARKEKTITLHTMQFLSTTLDNVLPAYLYDYKKTSMETKVASNGDISTSWKYQGRKKNDKQEVCKEEVKLIPSYQKYKTNLDNEIKYYEEKLSGGELNEQQTIDFSKKVQELEIRLINCMKNQPINRNQGDKIENWANSDYFRDLLRGDPQLAPGQTLNDRIKRYEEILATRYQPLVVNQRIHTHTINDNEVSIVREAVSSDMSNGYTNLRELKAIEKEIGQPIPDYSTYNRVLGNIRTIQKEEIAKGNEYVEVTAGYALKQLSLGSLENTIQARREFLQSQFLQGLMTKLEAASEKSPELKENFSIAHVGVLNHKSNDVDPIGFCHNEANEMLDMAEIYKEFNGKTLICDGKGPFIDENGDVHLPAKYGNDGRKVTLSATMINLSPQGHTKNDGVSRELNQEAVETFKDILITKHGSWEKVPPEIISQYDQLCTILNSDKSSFEKAAEATLCINALVDGVSCGCLSAKDRTSALMAIICDILNKDLDPGIRNKIMVEQFKKGPGIEIVRQNTDQEMLKVSALDIPGLTDNISGVINSPARYIGQADGWLDEKKQARIKSTIMKPTQ